MDDEQLLWELVDLLNEAHDQGEWNDTAEGVYCLLKEYRPRLQQSHLNYCREHPND